MPSSVGPNTFGEENLVFGYDLGDVANSYKGEPTSNIIADPLYALGTKNAYYDNNNTGWGTVTRGRIEEVIGPFGKPVQAYSQELISYNSSNRSIEGQPQEVVDNSNCLFNLTVGTTYRISVWIKATYTSTSENRLYLSGTAAVGDGTNRQVTVEWQRFSKTFSPSTTGNYYMRHYDYSTKQTGAKIWYALPQVEVDKGHDTQFTTGTRSATQGLIDLKSTSTINLSNVSFDSNAQMTFDGTNDYITLSSTSHPTGSCSMEIVFNHTHNFVGSRYLLYGASGTAFWVFFRGDWAGNLLYFTRRVTNSGNYGDSAWGYTTGIYQPVPANETMHLIFTHDATTGEFKCYKNGILTRTVNGNLAAYGALNTTQQSHYIGGSPGDNLPMTLPLFKFYDRVLSSSEVQSNYKAIKGRFNI